ncbi:hypothetical protein CONLIGDRAFT_710374 [Coniochaeta ligniaria NRRL 30616]|uniref:Uncharacterized protein n=1 Tax=Coniochaeta ligniaria NRRL 30616 TaxID=1408157 RepID=A0A1J7J6N8_9PEZI|nr:hypothetical protein CONLIGDRAFT_710374 [Coniochaeta ligniaria NRRL 30616]
MYGSSATQPAVRQPPISRTGSFYYDYSEDFQEHSMPIPCEPVSPMPRRVPSMSRPVVFDNSCEPIGSGAASMDDAAADLHHSDSPSSPARSYPEPGDRFSRLQCQSGQEDAVHVSAVDTSPQTESVIRNELEVPQDMISGNSDSDSSPAVSEEDAASTADATALERGFSDASEPLATVHIQKQEQSLVNSDESVASDAASSTVHLVFNHPQTKEHPLGDAIEDTAPETPSAITDSAASRGSESTKGSSGMPETPTLAARRRSNVYSLQPGLLDLKSFVQDLDDAGLLHDADISGSSLDSSKTRASPAKLHGRANVHELLARTNKALEDQTDRIDTYRNIQEPAVPNAITRLKTGVISGRQSVDDSKSIILAPQPVSPARQLRLRSSVSKLMKALPPLPDTSTNPAMGSAIIPFVGRRLPELPAPPRIFLSGSGQLSPPRKPGGFDGTSECGAGMFNGTLTSNSHTGLAQGEDASHDIYGDIWDTHFGRHDPAATVMGMESNSSALAQATVKRTEDILRTRAEKTGPCATQLHPLGPRGQFKSSTMRSKPIVRETSAHLNSISQARGASLDTSRHTFQRPEVPSKDTMPVDKNAVTDNHVRPHRGLKKRLSDFKIRLTESRHRPVDWSSSDVRVHEGGEVIGMAVPVTSSTGSPESNGNTSNPNSATDESSARGLRYKISRWMKTAKNAVNACKRLSSSTGGTSLDTDF